MEIGGANFSNVQIGGKAPAETTSLAVLQRQFQTATVRARESTRTVLRQVSSLHDKAEVLNKLGKNLHLIRSGGSDGPAIARGDALSLVTTPAYSALRSTEELNTTTTSYSTTSPTWTGRRLSGAAITGTSTTSVTIGGEYTGDYTGTLKVSSRNLATIGGAQAIAFDIYTSEGDLLDTVQWDPYDPAGTVVASSIGLEFSMSAGKVARFDTFQVSVDADDPIDVDPDAALSDAALESSVSNGAFQLNGVTITVDVADSLSDLLDQINASGAGVVATLDGDAVVLTRTTASTDDITLSGDTSGLVAALKLDTAITAPGVADERTIALDQVDDFLGVVSGSFTLNGVEISIDPDSDSLDDVLDRINASGAGVVASLSSGKVTLRSTGDAAISLSGDSSGFLDAVGIEEGDIGGAEEDGGLGQRGSRQAARKLARAIAELMEPLNEIFAKNDAISEDIRLDRITVQSKIRGAIRTAFSDRDLSAESNDLGLEFNLSSDEEEGAPVLDMRLSDVRTLEEALRKNPRELKLLLFGSNQHAGLLTQLVDAADSAAADLEASLADSGALLGTYA